MAPEVLVLLHTRILVSIREIYLSDVLDPTALRAKADRRYCGYSLRRAQTTHIPFETCMWSCSATWDRD